MGYLRDMGFVDKVAFVLVNDDLDRRTCRLVLLVAEDLFTALPPSHTVLCRKGLALDQQV